MHLSSLTNTLTFIQERELHKQFIHIQCGIEKESLRITKDGQLSQTDHPSSLGSTLTHPSITTDYSESLLELITGVHSSAEECLEELDAIHRFVYQSLENEMLWVASMPCFIADEKSIPIAKYGASNIGTMKHVYRIGLEKRYGRLMQTIAGIHYNFSLKDDFWINYQQALNNSHALKDFKTDQYFHLIRNFQRHAWLLVYLFGASPAICKSFVRDRDHQLEELENGDLGMPYGTCLRMGDLGYQSDAQKDLKATYKDLDSYIETILPALTKEHPAYADIGTEDESGRIQLNNNILQIENEFYSIIRPKNVAKSGEAPLIALKNRGIEYIEVRCLDLNPSLPMGINAQQIHFINAFLMFCLFSPSDELNDDALTQSRDKFKTVVTRGLQPDLMFSDGSFKYQATEIMAQIANFSELLDDAHNDTRHSDSFAIEKAKIDNAELTPAGQILKTLNPDNASTQHFFTWNLKRCEHVSEYFKTKPLSEVVFKEFKQLAEVSFKKQKDIEASDNVDFSKFLSDYYEQYKTL